MRALTRHPAAPDTGTPTGTRRPTSVELAEVFARLAVAVTITDPRAVGRLLDRLAGTWHGQWFLTHALAAGLRVTALDLAPDAEPADPPGRQVDGGPPGWLLHRNSDGKWVAECQTPGCLWSASTWAPELVDYHAADHAAVCQPDPFEGSR
jgi:hypothetical protein